MPYDEGTMKDTPLELPVSTRENTHANTLIKGISSES
jgi:hypothetical protein